MTGVTGAGPWPGLDLLEAQRVVLGELATTAEGVSGLPFAVLLTDRGPWGDLVGRATALLVDLPAELGPHGWRLTGRPGSDLARSRAHVRDDLDALAVAAHGWAGPLVVPVAGPVTLAASIDLARGDRVLSDPAALRDVAESLGSGLADHLAALSRAVPGARPVVLLHEPLLAAAIEAQVPTFSGRATLRALSVQLAGERVSAVLGAVWEAGAAGVTVHVGASLVGLPAVTGAGADAVAVELAAVGSGGWEQLAEAVESGTALWAGLAGSSRASGTGSDVPRQADQLLRPWAQVGLTAAALGQVVLVAAPGDGSSAGARAALADAVRTAALVAERAAR